MDADATGSAPRPTLLFTISGDLLIELLRRVELGERTEVVYADVAVHHAQEVTRGT